MLVGRNSIKQDQVMVTFIRALHSLERDARDPKGPSLT